MLALILSVAVDLAAPEPARVAAAVAAVEADPDEAADELLAAARACEDRLADPARALRLYERVLRERPDARAAIAAGRRARELRPAAASPAEADALAQLIAAADALPPAEVASRADALAARPWPGAPAAALWVASWQQREGRCADARPRFEALAARWPGTPEAADALSGATRCALDAHAWTDAEALAARLPVDEPGDRFVRDDALRAATRGRLRDRLRLAAGMVLAAVLAGLLLALARAPGGRRRWRPPIEAIFLAPIAALLIAVAATALPAFTAAVATIALGGLALTYLSGAALAARRAAGHAVRGRALVHAAACAVAALALADIAITGTDLVDQVVETVRSGPE